MLDKCKRRPRARRGESQEHAGVLNKRRRRRKQQARREEHTKVYDKARTKAAAAERQARCEGEASERATGPAKQRGGGKQMRSTAAQNRGKRSEPAKERVRVLDKAEPKDQKRAK